MSVTKLNTAILYLVEIHPVRIRIRQINEGYVTEFQLIELQEEKWGQVGKVYKTPEEAGLNALLALDTRVIR